MQKVATDQQQPCSNPRFSIIPPKISAPTRVSFQGCCLMGMWGICFSRTRRRRRNPTPRLLCEPTSLLKQETFSCSRKRVRSETHACQMGEHMYKLGLIRSFYSVRCSPLGVTPFFCSYMLQASVED